MDKLNLSAENYLKAGGRRKVNSEYHEALEHRSAGCAGAQRKQSFMGIINNYFESAAKSYRININKPQDNQSMSTPNMSYFFSLPARNATSPASQQSGIANQPYSLSQGQYPYKQSYNAEESSDRLRAKYHSLAPNIKELHF